MKNTSYTAFVDEFTRGLSADPIVLDCVSNVKWDEEREMLLIQVEPRNDDVYDESKEVVVDRIRSIEGLSFKADAWEGRINGRRIIIFKITPEGSDGKATRRPSNAPKVLSQGSNPAKRYEPQAASQAARDY